MVFGILKQALFPLVGATTFVVTSHELLLQSKYKNHSAKEGFKALENMKFGNNFDYFGRRKFIQSCTNHDNSRGLNFALPKNLSELKREPILELPFSEHVLNKLFVQLVNKNDQISTTNQKVRLLDDLKPEEIMNDTKILVVSQLPGSDIQNVTDNDITFSEIEIQHVL